MKITIIQQDIAWKDVATNNMITDALSAAGVLQAEHFVVVGKKYVGIMNHLKNSFVQSP